jgi:hypothetical protein
MSSAKGTWGSADCAAASAEGWGLFEVGENGRMQLQRDDEAVFSKATFKHGSMCAAGSRRFTIERWRIFSR